MESDVVNIKSSCELNVAHHHCPFSPPLYHRNYLTPPHDALLCLHCPLIDWLLEPCLWRNDEVHDHYPLENGGLMSVLYGEY